MANQHHLDILKQGVEIWNQWREEHRDIKPDLRKASLEDTDLSGANLEDADLSGANLKDADLRNTYLKDANLSGANLKDAYLDDAYLYRAKMCRVNLKEAELTGVDLTEADLSRARLNYANLNGAVLTETNLTKADLSGALLVGAYLNRANLNEANLSGALLIGADLSRAFLLGADLSGANLSRAYLNETDLTLAYLVGANLTNAVLVKANLMDAFLNNCRVYGIAAWDIVLEGTEQSNLIITDTEQPTITVDNLEIAQFIYLFLEYKKLRDIFNSVTERGVLLLGRFGDGLEVLQAIATRLREMNYLPIIFDFERPDSRDFTETIMTLVGLSRFVIVDLSGPAVPNELRATIPCFKIPFVPIIEDGRKTFSMFPDLLGYPWVLPPVRFASKEHLMELLQSRVIEPAEEKFRERQALLNQLFNG